MTRRVGNIIALWASYLELYAIVNSLQCRICRSIERIQIARASISTCDAMEAAADWLSLFQGVRGIYALHIP
jgi:hypothetical protein